MEIRKIPTTELVRELIRRFDMGTFEECEKSFCELAREINAISHDSGEDDELYV